MILKNKYRHVPILCGKVAEMLVWNKSGIYVDGTIGGGGHANAILDRLDRSGQVIGLDKDQDAVRVSINRLTTKNDRRVKVIHSDFSDVGSVLKEQGVSQVDGVLLDLGVSSYQIDRPDRGFSFMAEGPLDMRMDQNNRLTAADIVNRSSKEEIEEIIRAYGEERQARRVANAIINAREKEPLTTTSGLAKAVVSAVRGRWAVKSCARVFQAFRIAVNNELDKLKIALDSVIPLLRVKGRLGVISYHSLEDRIVKQIFKQWSADCICPPGIPMCICRHEPVARLLTKRPIIALQEEVMENSRARSAKLRMVECIQN